MLTVVISVKAASIIETGRVATWNCIFISINYFSRTGHSKNAFLGAVLWFCSSKKISRLISR